MPPHWVRDLLTYWEWLDRQVRDSGGRLANRSYIEPEAYYGDDDDEIQLLDIRDHVLVFQGHFLKFTITADAADLGELAFYEFHHGQIGEAGLIWRACKNGHRDDELGSKCHVHVGTAVVPAREVDLDDAIDGVYSRVPPGI